MPSRPRLLVPITYGFSVRYLVPTGVLDLLDEHFDVVVGLGWDDPTLRDRLVSTGRRTVDLPAASLAHGYRMYRRRLELVHQRRLSSPTSRIQRRLKRDRMRRSDQWIGRLRRAVDGVTLALPGASERAELAEDDHLDRGTNIGEFEAFLRDERIDLVLSVTPYHDQDALLLRAADRTGVTTVTAVISFDNPTTRARLVAPGASVPVWNRHNAAEMVRSYPDLTEERVPIVGAPQFDLHRRRALVLDEQRWREALDLPPDRPIILYGASPTLLIPDEDVLFRAIDDQIELRRVRGNPFLLVRRHPVDVGSPVPGGSELGNGRIVEPWSTGSGSVSSWPDDLELAMQMSSFAHSAVHLSICSSMCLDGAMFDRPQIGPEFIPGGDRRSRRRLSLLYAQEHWAPIRRSGAIRTAADMAQLVAAINEELVAPERRSAARRRLLDDVLTFHDGSASRRLVDEVVRVDRARVSPA